MKQGLLCHIILCYRKFPWDPDKVEENLNLNFNEFNSWFKLTTCDYIQRQNSFC
jgi:hypothetical protein